MKLTSISMKICRFIYSTAKCAPFPAIMIWTPELPCFYKNSSNIQLCHIAQGLWFVNFSILPCGRITQQLYGSYLSSLLSTPFSSYHAVLWNGRNMWPLWKENQEHQPDGQELDLWYQWPVQFHRWPDGHKCTGVSTCFLDFQSIKSVRRNKTTTPHGVLKPVLALAGSTIPSMLSCHMTASG